MNETYTLGYGPASIAMMSWRSADVHAAFFLKHLKPGMCLLDIGCGPGTISLGFANRVAPGEVIGIELDLAQTGPIAAQAAEAGLNLRFECASAYELPFEDCSLDAVFLSALVGNLQYPETMFSEILRVLKPGGIVGIKEFDHGANIGWPKTEFTDWMNDLYTRLRLENGHDPDSGRKVRGYLSTAGFSGVMAEAIFETAPAGTYTGSPVMEAMVREEWGPQFIKRGWTTSSEVERMIALSEAYTTGPDAFYATAWVEAVAFKPSDDGDGAH